MKVHVLWYDYYEDSRIVGIYTEEGKRKKIEELQEEALKYCREIQEIYEAEVSRHKEARAKHLIEVNEAIALCKDFPDNKELHKYKKRLIKKDEQLLRSIKLSQLNVDKYSPENALGRYMNNQNMMWLEKEVIE